MNDIDSKIKEINYIEDQANKNQWMNNIHPLVKLLLTIIYIVFVVSVQKYDLTPLLLLMVYPILMMNFNSYSWKLAFRRISFIMPFIIVVGIFNPIYDRNVIWQIENIKLTGGMISMITMLLKGILAVFASYLLIISTSIEKICYSLRLLHLPKLFVQEILLIYRYISVLMNEVNRITQAYSLRAPKQKGINYRVWGSLVGQLLLRSMDRSTVLYESMCLRGFSGEFYYNSGQKLSKSDLMFGFICLTVMALCRFCYFVM